MDKEKEKMKWNSVKGIKIPEKLKEWKEISYLFPPSFFTVWVMNGKRKQKGWFDAPCRRWLEDTESVWQDKLLHKVHAWAEIEKYTFKMQMEEADEMA